jgi:phenylacetate-CoA ligase
MIISLLLKKIIFKNRINLIKYKTRLYKEVSDREKIEQYQLESFNKIWADITRSNPFYKMWKAKHDLPHRINSIEDLKYFPILTKKDIQKNQGLIFNHLGNYDTISTGGSTGQPTNFPTSKNEQNLNYANTYLAREWWGIKPYDSCLLFWGHSHLFGVGARGRVNKYKRVLYDWIINTTRFSAYDMSLEALGKYSKKLQNYNPTMILGYTSSICKISKYAQENSIDISNAKTLRGVVVTSETVAQYDIDLIESVFKTPCIVEYGMAETGVIAYSKEKTNNIKVFWDSFLCQRNKEGELLISTLTDKLFPLINYSTGDIINSVDGSSILTINKIIGRRNDFITIFDKGGTKSIHSEFFTHVLKSIPMILNFRIKQRLDLSIEISYISRKAQSIDKLFFDEVKKEYKNIEFDQFLFKQVDDIPKTLSGKAKWVEVEKKN